MRVIWPGSFLRVGNKAQNGFMPRYAITTQPILAGIQTRTELYDTIGYSGIESLDNSITSVLPSQELIRKDNSRHSNRRLSMAEKLTAARLLNLRERHLTTAGAAGAAPLAMSDESRSDRSRERFLQDKSAGVPSGRPVSRRLVHEPAADQSAAGFCHSPAWADLLFQRIEDHSETPISAAPPRPVMTSGICTKDCRNMITDSAMMA